MDNIKIISSGEKIKNIRKSLGLKQDEITGNEITRNLISMIENDKVRLSTNAAEVIANNINNVCKQRNIDFRVTASYLLQDEKIQATLIVDKYIKFLNENSNNSSMNLSDDIEGIDQFLINNEVDINKKITVYKIIGNIFNLKNEYHSSYTYYLKAFENGNKILSNTELADLLIKLMYCCIKLNRYNEALYFGKLVLNYNQLPDKLKFKLSFNSALAYKKLNLYNESLEEINHITTSINELSNDNKFKIFTLKANCLQEIKYYKEALDEYKHILSVLGPGDRIKQLVIMCNMMDIYIYFEDIKNVKRYIDKIISIADNLEELPKDDYVPQIYLDVANAGVYINSLDIAKDYYRKAISSAKLTKQYELLLNSLDKLFDIYSKENNLNELDNIKNELLEIISIDSNSEVHRLIYKFIDFYNTNDDKDGIKALIKFVLER